MLTIYNNITQAFVCREVTCLFIGYMHYECSIEPPGDGGGEGREVTCLFVGYMHYECSIEPPGDKGGALFGRCPTKLVNQATREPSMKVRYLYHSCICGCTLTLEVTNPKNNNC